MVDSLHTVLRVVHIGAAIFWVGGATLWGAIIMPTLSKMGPPPPRDVIVSLGAKVVKALPHAGALTFLAGLATFLQMQSAGGVGGTWQMLMGLALVVTLVVLILAYGVLVPTFKKIAAMPAGPPGPEMPALQKRMMKVSEANMALVWLVVVLMVVAVALRTT